MLKKLSIGKKLITAFIIVTLLASLSGIISTFVMTSMGNKYSDALINYGFAQGDIGKALVVLSENRRAVRDIVAFTERENIDSVKLELTETWDKFNTYMVAVEKGLMQPATKQMYAEIQSLIPQYVAKRDEVVKLGDTTDPERSLQARKKALEELDPIYKNIYDHCVNIMNDKVDTGTKLSIELTKQQKMSVITIIVLILISWLLALGLSISITRGIAGPVRKCAERLLNLSKGDLKGEVPVFDNQDETGMLADATKTIVDGLNTIIEDEAYLLSEMGRGNFAVSSSCENSYVGDFKQVFMAVQSINHSLSKTLLQINQSSDQVASGANQVSDGAQALSQGATEQASSVEELAATVNDISNQVKSNAQGAELANQNVNKVALELTSSNEQMQELIHAMSEITQSSSEIGKIIKTIEDIAFQTNILALNAAVEAARAGAAGKGFAVVADEVRNLASKSAEASSNTSQLIERSIQSVANGTRIADQTAQSLLTVVDDTKEIVQTINNISSASKTQAEAITQVTLGIDQISSVVQTNSATAEQSAAASQELSGQAQILKDLVSNFKLRHDMERNEDIPVVEKGISKPAYTPSSPMTSFETESYELKEEDYASPRSYDNSKY